MLGLRFCVRAVSSCGERGPLFIAVHGPLTIAASLVAEHRLQTCRLSSCGSRAQLLRGMWYLPRPGLEPVSPALAGRFSTTAPPGKPPVLLSYHPCIHWNSTFNFLQEFSFALTTWLTVWYKRPSFQPVLAFKRPSSLSLITSSFWFTVRDSSFHLNT